MTDERSIHDGATVPIDRTGSASEAPTAPTPTVQAPVAASPVASPTRPTAPVREEPAPPPAPASGRTMPVDRRDVVAREKARFGGIKWGAAFFGWLSAVGLTVLLAGVVGGIAAAIGSSIGVPADVLTENAATVGTVGGILLLIVVFVGYLAGGYVAGRMARFSGAKQGVAVWLWSVVIGVVVTIIGLMVGTPFGGFGPTGLPQLSIDEGNATVAGIISLLLTLAVTLAGAVAGGLLGMRYHRRVDREGFGS